VLVSEIATGSKQDKQARVRKAVCRESGPHGLEQGKGASPTYCYTMYNEKALNPVQTWLLDFSAMCHYTKFGMISASAASAENELEWDQRLQRSVEHALLIKPFEHIASNLGN
jgi:hypothetical protein